MNGIETNNIIVRNFHFTRLILAAFVAIIALVAIGHSNANAQSSAKFRQYDRAVKAQQAQLNKTIAAGRKCGFILSSKCRRVQDSVRKMKANLRSLKATRAKYANATRSRKIERPTKKELNARRKNEKPRRRTLLEQVFGVKTYNENGHKSQDDDYEGEVKVKRNYNTVRSLCVRTCDGYYFPVSFSTTKDRLQQDFDQCAKMCPGTETALFYHKMPSQDAEESISYRTGKPYSSLENAFAYRKSVNPACSCRYSDDKSTPTFEELAGATKAEVEEVAKVEPEIHRIGLPVYRQDPTQDPDTLDNENCRLDIATLKDLTSKDNDKKLSERNNTNIRIVGPAFFPAQ